MKKIVLIDFGYYLHKAIFASINLTNSSPMYLCMSMILGDMRRIGVNKEDEIIIACDKGRSWRKDVDAQYKHTRKAKKAKATNINWDKCYKESNELLENLQNNTPFKVIGIWNTEADDVISYCVRKYHDKECIIMSVDEDFEQLFCFDNVKIYSPHPKRKTFKVPPKNPYKLLLKKVEKEASDDLTNPVTNEKEFNDRFLIVSLLTLPEEIEAKIEEELKNNDFEKSWNYGGLRFPSLNKRFKDMYKQDKVINYNKAVKQKSI